MKTKFVGLLLVLFFGFSAIFAQQGEPSRPKELSPDKAREEYEKKRAEIEEKNRKIAENNAKVSQALTDGIAAYNAKNYVLAIEKFELGYRLDPDYVGSAPVFLNNKAMSLRMHGMQIYNEAVLSKRNPGRAANRYFLDAIAAARTAQKMLVSADVPTDERERRIFDLNIYLAAKEIVLSLEVVILSDSSRLRATLDAFEAYFKVEADEVKKSEARERLRKLKIKFGVGK